MNEKRTCNNCRTELFGEFCSSCGQRDMDLYIPLKELASEFIDVLPAFDRLLIRSLKPLIMKPGATTLEYLNGKRKQFVSPFKMYFVISFLFFLVSSMADDSGKRQTAISMVSSGQSVQTGPTDTAFVSIGSKDKGMRFTVKDSAQVERVFGSTMIKALQNLKANPSLMFDKIKEHRPKVIFLLLPVFALLLKLLYIRSGTFYIKHLVFSFYFHSFLFMVMMAVEVIQMVDLPLVGYLSVPLYLALPVNLYYGLKRVYGQTGWKTMVKFLLLSVSYTFTFFMTVSLSAVIIILLFYT